MPEFRFGQFALKRLVHAANGRRMRKPFRRSSERATLRIKLKPKSQLREAEMLEKERLFGEVDIWHSFPSEWPLLAKRRGGERGYYIVFDVEAGEDDGEYNGSVPVRFPTIGRLRAKGDGVRVVTWKGFAENDVLYTWRLFEVPSGALPVVLSTRESEVQCYHPSCVSGHYGGADIIPVRWEGLPEGREGVLVYHIGAAVLAFPESKGQRPNAWFMVVLLDGYDKRQLPFDIQGPPLSISLVTF